MGIIFSCCFNFKDPSTPNANHSVPQNNGCLRTVLHEANSSGPTIRNSATAILAPEIPNGRIINSILRSTVAPVAVSIPGRTREAEKISSSEGTSGSRVAERRVPVLVPKDNGSVSSVNNKANSSGSTSSNSTTPILAPEIPNDRIINSILRSTDVPVAVSIPDRNRAAEKISSSEGTSDSRVAEPRVTVLVPEENGSVSSVQKPHISPSVSLEKKPLPNIYNEFNEVFLSPDEEDVCPTCYEDYDIDNPKITTECSHDFHLSCIYAWMERSDTCPICSRVMVFNEAA